MTLMADGLEWARVYWTRGPGPRGSMFLNAVSDPPCSGWNGAVIIPGEKRSTIFCPYTFDSYTVPNDCGELKGAKMDEPFNLIKFTKFLPERWAELQSMALNRDYDTAVLVFKRLGLPIPEQMVKGGEEDVQKKGGKDVSSELKKPVKLSSKRGKFLAWFLEEGTRSVREAMAEFGMSRSNALSYLYMLKKDHGIGYELVGDNASVALPDGCENPFDEDWSVG